jgi:hypothetical protein
MYVFQFSSYQIILRIAKKNCVSYFWNSIRLIIQLIFNFQTFGILRQGLRALEAFSYHVIKVMYLFWHDQT